MLTVMLFGLCTRFNAIAEKFRIEGRALVSGVRTEEWTPFAHVLLDDKNHVGFLRLDGSFTVNDVPSGCYVVHIVSPVYSARRVNYLKTSEVVQLPYPVQIRCTGRHSYFTKQDTWSWSDFFMNPMVLMMVFPLLIILLLPKLINMNDPGMGLEMEQSMNMLNPSPEIPDVSELMTKFFAPPKSQGKSGTQRGHRGSVPRRR